MALTKVAPTTRPRAQLDLAAFLDRFPEVVDERDGWVVTCPAHADGSPSLHVAVNEQESLLLHCRAGCSKTAVLDALGLTMADLFSVNVGAIAPRSVTAPSPLDDAELGPLHLYLSNAASALADRGTAAHAYASSRFGVDAVLAEALGLGFDDGSVPHPGLGLSATAYRADDRLVVPFRDFDGVPRGLQARALSATAGVRWSGPVNPESGSSWAKHGVFRGESGLPGAEIVITEGPGDALTVAAAGYDSVCVRGATLGANVALADHLAANLQGHRVIVAGDADAAGAAFIATICEALSSRGVNTHRLTIPQGLSDVTEWREADPASFRPRFAAAVQTAAPYGQDQILADRLRVEATQVLTDVFNARALLDFIRSNGADVRYTDGAGFLIYPGHHVGVWQRDDKSETIVRGYAQDAANFIQRRVLDKIHALESAELSIGGTDESKADVRKAIGSLRRRVTTGALIRWAMGTQGLNAMIRELKALAGVYMPYSAFDQHPDLLAVANGVVNLETGHVTPYGDDTRSLYITRKVHVPYVDGAVCPRWDTFVADLFRDFPDVPAYMQRLLGYGITGHTSEQIIAVLYGGGANGKGTLIETVQHIMAEYLTVTPFSTFERRSNANSSAPSPDIAALAGARLVLASEGDPGRPMAEALLKSISGGDTLSARFLHLNTFSFEPSCLIVLQSNYKPEIRGQDHGIWRRLRLIPFTRQFEGAEKDKHLRAKFRGQYVPDSAWRPGDAMGDGPAGILAWLIRGAIAWYRDGLGEPATVTRATAEYRSTSDQLGDFIHEKLVVDPRGTIKATELFKLYLDWAEEEHLSPKDTWKKTTVIHAMEERRARAYTREGSKWLRGYRVRTQKDVIPDAHPEDLILSNVLPT